MTTVQQEYPETSLFIPLLLNDLRQLIPPTGLLNDPVNITAAGEKTSQQDKGLMTLVLFRLWQYKDILESASPKLSSTEGSPQFLSLRKTLVNNAKELAIRKLNRLLEFLNQKQSPSITEKLARADKTIKRISQKLLLYPFLYATEKKNVNYFHAVAQEAEGDIQRILQHILFVAVEKNVPAIIEYIREKHPQLDPNTQRGMGETALHTATLQAKAQAVTALLGFDKINLGIKDYGKRTALELTQLPAFENSSPHKRVARLLAEEPVAATRVQRSYRH